MSGRVVRCTPESSVSSVLDGSHHLGHLPEDWDLRGRDLFLLWLLLLVAKRSRLLAALEETIWLTRRVLGSPCEGEFCWRILRRERVRPGARIGQL